MLSPTYVNITYLCNYRCIYCVNITPPSYYTLSLDEIKKYPWAKQVTLSGGEPTLHPQFKEIVEYFKSQGIELGIQTNGSTLDRHLDFLVENFASVEIPVYGITNDCASEITGVFLDEVTRRGYIKALDQKIPQLKIVIVGITEALPDIINTYIRATDKATIVVSYPLIGSRIIKDHVPFLTYQKFYSLLPSEAEAEDRLVITGTPYCMDVLLTKGHRWERAACTVSPMRRIPECFSCSKKEECKGIPQEYLKRFPM